MQISETLTSKILEKFIDILPEEELRDMIIKEVNSFVNEETTFNIKHKEGSWYDKEEYYLLTSKGSPFRCIIWKMMIKRVEEIMKQYMEDNFTGTSLGMDSNKLDEKMKNIVAQNLPNAINQYFSMIAENSSHRLRYEIKNNMSI